MTGNLLEIKILDLESVCVDVRACMCMYLRQTRQEYVLKPVCSQERFRSPEPRAPGELIEWWPPPSVCRQHFQRTSSLKLLGQFELNFICSLQAKGKR